MWRNEACVAAIQAHRGPVLSALLTQNVLYTCGHDGLLKSWNLQTFSPIVSLDVGQMQGATVKHNFGIFPTSVLTVTCCISRNDPSQGERRSPAKQCSQCHTSQQALARNKLASRHNATWRRWR